MDFVSRMALAKKKKAESLFAANSQPLKLESVSLSAVLRHPDHCQQLELFTPLRNLISCVIERGSDTVDVHKNSRFLLSANFASRSSLMMKATELSQTRFQYQCSARRAAMFSWLTPRLLKRDVHELLVLAKRALGDDDAKKLRLIDHNEHTSYDGLS